MFCFFVAGSSELRVGNESRDKARLVPAGELIVEREVRHHLIVEAFRAAIAHPFVGIGDIPDIGITGIALGRNGVLAVGAGNQKLGFERHLDA